MDFNIQILYANKWSQVVFPKHKISDSPFSGALSEFTTFMRNGSRVLMYSVQGLDLPSILVETERRGLSFDKLLTIPEQDDWLYTDGKSTSCIAFILEMYKEAGLFDPVASSIQVTEFTVSFSRIVQRLFYLNR